MMLLFKYLMNFTQARQITVFAKKKSFAAVPFVISCNLSDIYINIMQNSHVPRLEKSIQKMINYSQINLRINLENILDLN